MKTNIKLDEFANGYLRAQVINEMDKVRENIADTQTSAVAKRKVNITLTFVPDKTRDIIATDIEVVSKLAPAESYATTIMTDGDEFSELKSGIKGQTMFDLETGEVLSDKGEPMTETEKTDEKITRIGGQA